MARIRIRSKTLRIVLVVLLVTALGAAIYLTLPLLQGGGDSEKEQKELTSSDLSSMAYEGEIDKALEGYDALLDAEQAEDKRWNLYVQKSMSALHNALWDEALKAGQHADDIKSSDVTLGIIAEAYYGKGENDAALNFFKKAATQAENDDQDSTYYRQKVAELDGDATE